MSLDFACWWFPFLAGAGLAILAARAVRAIDAELSAAERRRCETVRRLRAAYRSPVVAVMTSSPDRMSTVSYTLVAMSASGETLVVRAVDSTADQLWLVRAEGAGDPLLLDDERAGHAIDRYGLDRVGQTFGDWEDLDAYRQERAAAITPEAIVDADAFDDADVRELVITEEAP